MSLASDRERRDLDYALALDGMNIELRSVTPGPAGIYLPVTVRAVVRRYQPEELVGGITQSHRRIIISPTQIEAEGWPGPQSSSDPSTRDRRVPKKGDKAIVAGRMYNVEDAHGIYVDDGLVRIEMQALG